VSLEGERPRVTPDFARTLAIASALSDHNWLEPYVREEERAEARRELDEMAGRGDAVVVDRGAGGDSSEEQSSEQGGEEGGVDVGADEIVETEEGGSPSTKDERPVWPKGLVGLI